MKNFIFPNQNITYLSILNPSKLQETLQEVSYQEGVRIPNSMKNQIKFLGNEFSKDKFSITYLNYLLVAKGTITPYQTGTNEHSIINLKIEESWFASLFFSFLLASSILNGTIFFLKKYYTFPFWISKNFGNDLPIHTIVFLCLFMFGTHYSAKLFKKSLAEVMKAEQITG